MDVEPETVDTEAVTDVPAVPVDVDRLLVVIDADCVD